MNADPEEHLKRYKDWRPSQFDAKGLGLEDRQDWFVAPVMRTRDSGVLEESNFAVVKRELEKANKESFEERLRVTDDPRRVESEDDSDDYEVHRFGHWGPGWFEIILCRPGSKCAQVAAEFACALSDYPVADDHHYSEMEMEEAFRIWKDSFTDAQRLEYIRKHRRDFEFNDFLEVIQTVRGTNFRGNCSELVSQYGNP